MALMLSKQCRASPYDVVLAGEYYYDLIFSDLGEMPRLGADVWSEDFDAVPGASYTTARAFSLLGVKVGWWCETGTDLFSQLMIAAATRDAIDTSLFQRREEARIRLSAAFSMAHDRGFISHFQGDETLPSKAEIERLGPRVLIVQGLTCRNDLADLFAFSRSIGVFCCLDCQHVGEDIADGNLAEILLHTDCFICNETEAKRLTGSESHDGALLALARYCPTVVIKRGADGTAALRAGQVIEIGAPQVQVVDTTGAGDSFNAGFVYGLLQGWQMEKALRAAVACGSACVKAHGGKALPRESELLQSMAEATW
ncbi:carbohydrate kinase family protein [Ensifer adhaerens]|nr:carbohydrate kinase family protein [Ensifer canadensis]